LHVLLVRLRLLGDVVFTTPAIRALRRRHPDARLTYLVERHAAPVVAGNPHLDEVIVADRPRGIARLAADAALAARLRRSRPDVVLDFHGGPRAGWLTWASGAPRRVGYAVAGRSWLYTDIVARPRELRPRHSVENQWDLLAALDPGFTHPPHPAADAVEMAEDPAAATRVTNRMRETGLEAGLVVVVVHVSAGNPFRRWPGEAFASLLVALADADPSRRIILSFGPEEAGAAGQIAAAARARLGSAADRIVDFGPLSIAELRALVARSALFVGGDTGPLHVAATTRTPIVGLYGPTLAERSAPWRDPVLVTESVDPGALWCRPCDQRRCVPGDFRCLAGIAPGAVATACERALGRARRHAAGIGTSV
jgi:ADP-heptose:LPS heptosyltransferase